MLNWFRMRSTLEKFIIMFEIPTADKAKTIDSYGWLHFKLEALMFTTWVFIRSYFTLDMEDVMAPPDPLNDHQQLQTDHSCFAIKTPRLHPASPDQLDLLSQQKFPIAGYIQKESFRLSLFQIFQVKKGAVQNHHSKLLLGGLEHFLFFHILGIIIPID